MGFAGNDCRLQTILRIVREESNNHTAMYSLIVSLRRCSSFFAPSAFPFYFRENFLRFLRLSPHIRDQQASGVSNRSHRWSHSIAANPVCSLLLPFLQCFPQNCFWRRQERVPRELPGRPAVLGQPLQTPRHEVNGEFAYLLVIHR